jgi:hypothetical protein
MKIAVISTHDKVPGAENTAGLCSCVTAEDERGMSPT